MRFPLAVALIFLCRACVHDQFIKTVTRVFYDDIPHHKGRLLQSTPSDVGRYPSSLCSLRIYADFTSIKTTDVPTINMIKRLVNISTLVFYNMLTVERLDTLYYPSNVSQNCKITANRRQYTLNTWPIRQTGSAESRHRNHYRRLNRSWGSKLHR